MGGLHHTDNTELAINYAFDTEKLDMLIRYLEQKDFRYKYEIEETNERGMNPLHDAIDWLGGFPYEVANHKAVINDFSQKVFELRKFRYKSEGG